VRGLSLSRPWPWAIYEVPGDDGKGIENRSWPPPIAMIGQRIALHAAKSWDDGAISFLIGLGLEPPSAFRHYPHSVIVGTAVIDRVVTESRTLGRQARWFFETRADGKQNYGWILADKRKLEAPIPCSGKQGLWTVPPMVEGLIRSQGAAP
jgi:hypothetical protein